MMGAQICREELVWLSTGLFHPASRRHREADTTPANTSGNVARACEPDALTVVMNTQPEIVNVEPQRSPTPPNARANLCVLQLDIIKSGPRMEAHINDYQN